jgi:predicted ATPase
MSMGEIDLACSAGINVMIGSDDSGKTSLLKLLYATLRSAEIYSREVENKPVSLKKILADKLQDTFQPGKKGLGELVMRPSNKEKLQVELEFKNDRLKYEDRFFFTFGDSTTTTIVEGQDKIKSFPDEFRAVFIPAKEVLTSLAAIRATRDNLRLPGFDDTYLDLIRSLVLPNIPGNIQEDLKGVNQELASLFQGQIEQVAEGEFVFKRAGQDYSMPLTAEGIKKIGIISTLIRNRQLNSTSVLFMEEPETALHPQAVRKLVAMMIQMAKAGIQIFLATHNYFVLKQIYISSRKEKVPAQCVILNRKIETEPVSCNAYDLAEGMPENALTIEALSMADDELALDFAL